MDILDEILDASGLTGGKIDKNGIMDKIDKSVKSILMKTHNNPTKHELLDKGNRINFACPYCGDSKNNANKKRGNIYKDGLWFKCYNSPCKTAPVWKFLEDFYEISNFSADEIIFLKSQADLSATSLKGDRKAATANQLGGFIGLQEYGFPRAAVMTNMMLKEVHTTDWVVDYLKSRRQLPSIYGDLNHFAYDRHNNALVIMNLDITRTKVMGLQLRYFKPKNIRFRSYNYGDLAEYAFSIKKDTIKPELLAAMNKVSLLYNFWQTDFTLPVLILESAIDSNHFKNSMGILSANTNIRLKNKSFYMYDNSTIDQAGADAAMKRLDGGYYVFMWSKFIDDYPIYRKCKDLNDIFKKRPIKIKMLMEYFTNDSLDIMDI